MNEIGLEEAFDALLNGSGGFISHETAAFNIINN
jgi:hypothetical protein